MSGAKKTARLGLMLAVAVLLTALEHSLPPPPFFPPHVRLGLSNIVVMYAVFFIGRPQAAGLNALKALFVFLTRGPMAGLLSLCGGLLSVAVIAALLCWRREKLSYTLAGVAGACAHNLGQYAAAAALVASPFWVYLLPALLVSGVAAGVATSALLRVTLPRLGAALIEPR